MEQLLANVRGAVDEHGRGCSALSALHQKRAASPPVPRVIGVAGAPDVADARHAARSAAAEDGDLQRHAALFGVFRLVRGTLLNRRKKFSLVAPARSASLTPLTAASRAAV